MPARGSGGVSGARQGGPGPDWRQQGRPGNWRDSGNRQGSGGSAFGRFGGPPQHRPGPQFGGRFARGPQRGRFDGFGGGRGPQHGFAGFGGRRGPQHGFGPGRESPAPVRRRSRTGPATRLRRPRSRFAARLCWPARFGPPRGFAGYYGPRGLGHFGPHRGPGFGGRQANFGLRSAQSSGSRRSASGWSAGAGFRRLGWRVALPGFQPLGRPQLRGLGILWTPLVADCNTTTGAGRRGLPAVCPISSCFSPRGR